MQDFVHQPLEGLRGWTLESQCFWYRYYNVRLAVP